MTELEKANKQVEKQLKYLKRMSCRPYRQLFNVSSLINSDSKLHHLNNYNPTTVALKRCAGHTIGYCGDSNGVQSGKCVPKEGSISNEDIYIFYRDLRQIDFLKIKVETHNACECIN